MTLEEENAALRAALRTLVEKVHYTLNHPSMNGAMIMSWVHGMPYDGPNVRGEMLAAQRLLGMPDELPKPSYPERPSVLVHRADDGTETEAMVGPLRECAAFADSYPDETFIFDVRQRELRAWVPPPPHVPEEVTPQLIKNVRDAVRDFDVTPEECKEVLIETQGNVRRSIKIIREVYCELHVVPRAPEKPYKVTVPMMREVRVATRATMAECKEALQRASGDVAVAITRLGNRES